jgi:hypothetical protein
MRAFLHAAIVVLLACGGQTTGDGAPAVDGGGPSSGSSTSGASSGSAGGTSSGPAVGSSSGSGVGFGADCTTTPCLAPLVCCPAVNLCTNADMMECASPVWVACTKQSDCTGGTVCCVTAATTIGSGPSGSLCRPTCLSTDQGYACNTTGPNGGVDECPGAAGRWTQCQQVVNTPASLGLCIGKPPSSFSLCPINMAYIDEAAPAVLAGTQTTCSDGGPCPANDCCLKYTGWSPPYPADPTACVPILPDGGF